MTEYYLLVIYGDVEAGIEGPFASDNERLARARDLREDSDEDGLHRLDIVDGKPRVDDFGAGEVDPVFKDEWDDDGNDDMDDEED